MPDLDSEPWTVILSNHILFSLWKKWIYIAYMLMVLSTGRSSQVDSVSWNSKKVRSLSLSLKQISTLPETNIALENRPLEKEIPIGNHNFGGELLVLGSVKSAGVLGIQNYTSKGVFFAMVWKSTFLIGGTSSFMVGIFRCHWILGGFHQKLNRTLSQRTPKSKLRSSY